MILVADRRAFIPRWASRPRIRISPCSFLSPYGWEICLQRASGGCPVCKSTGSVIMGNSVRRLSFLFGRHFSFLVILLYSEHSLSRDCFAGGLLCSGDHVEGVEMYVLYEKFWSHCWGLELITWTSTWISVVYRTTSNELFSIDIILNIACSCSIIWC